MKHFYFTSIFSILYTFVFAGGETLIVGAADSGKGSTSVTSQNVFSAHNNPAGISNIKNIEIGIFSSKAYFIKDINFFNISSAIPTIKSGVFGLDINYVGFSAFNETSFGISYARLFAEKISVGLKFDYLNISISDNGSKGFFAFGAGLQYQPIKVFRIGAFIYNPISSKINNNYNEKLASNFVLGFSYLPSKKLTISVDVNKELNSMVQLKTGFEYKAMKRLFFRIGAATNPTLLSFGLGTKFNNFKLDIASTYHLQLGLTPQISFKYNFKKRNLDSK